jgi:CxxC-x17-CxxC domain-containing protein
MRSYDQNSDLGAGRRFGGGNRREGGGSRGGFGGGRREGGDRPQMHSAICDECGRSCEVPFRPTGDKPIYCDNCFSKRRNDENGGGYNSFRKPERSFDRPRFGGGDRYESRGGDNNQLKEQLEALNSKLDRILRALETKVTTKPAKAEVVVAAPTEAKVEATAEAKAEKSPKKAAKKAAKKTTKKAKAE